MKKSIKEVEDLFAGQEDVVQTKRNYIINGEAHERMSNRIKSGYDTYTYAGAQALSDLFDETIGAALAGGATQFVDTKRKEILDKWNGKKGFYQKNDNISEWYAKRNEELAALQSQPIDIEAKKADIEKAQRQLDGVESRINPNANHPIFNVGQKHNDGNNYIVETAKDERTNTKEEGVEVITKILSPAQVDTNGKMIKAAKVEVSIFDSYGQKAIQHHEHK